MSLDKPMRPFFSYFGSKWSISRHYPPPRRGVLLVEPFAGAAGYSVRHNAREVLLIDRDPVIVAVWNFLIRATPEDIRSLPDLPVGGTIDDLDIPQAARWLIGFWLNKGHPTPGRSASAWMRNPKYACQFWGERVRERIAGQVNRINDWICIQGDYTDAPDHGDVFVDPPYVVQGHLYRFGSDRVDYAHLADWCRSRRERVIVCEQEGAIWLPFQFLMHAKATTKRGGGASKSAEVVYIQEARGGDMTERKTLDQYNTPYELVVQLLQLVDDEDRFSGSVMDPHCGSGAWLRWFKTSGRDFELVANDIDPEVVGFDYVPPESQFSNTWLDDSVDWPQVDYIVGNPPFTDAEEHVERMVSRASEGCCVLVRLAFLASQKRAPFWKRYHDICRMVWVLQKRPSFLSVKGTDRYDYVFFWFDKRHTGGPHLAWTAGGGSHNGS